MEGLERKEEEEEKDISKETEILIPSKIIGGIYDKVKEDQENKDSNDLKS